MTRFLENSVAEKSFISFKSLNVESRKERKKKYKKQLVMYFLYLLFRALIVDLFQWIFNCGRKRIHSRFSSLDRHFRSNSSQLIVYIHGVNGSPKRASDFLAALQDYDHLADIYGPTLPNYFNCEFESAMQPILNLVKKYRAKFPSNEITVIGYSYGTLGVKHIEDSIDGVKCFYISALFKGTKFATYLNWFGILRLLWYHKDVIKNLLWKSNDPSFKSSCSIKRTFIYSDSDERVFPAETSKGVGRNIILKGYTHHSILPKALDIILESLFHNE